MGKEESMILVPKCSFCQAERKVVQGKFMLSPQEFVIVFDTMIV